MLKNADCTLYRYNKVTQGYDRFFIPGVYWRENKAGNVLKSGLQSADSTTVYIYSDRALPENLTKDMLVKGDCCFQFDNTSPQTVSESMKEFCRLHRFVTVTSIDDCFFGSLPHFEISAK
ncbi:MAG: hypothetical protein NC122_07050 [Faecalibacterium sp.]|nr:hypothetical protein [Ruminococcus sp.]MCM1392264.1 hypothetical protein [Ruminococcus sp.]MCM1485948.1 hypothetical protein [Faecalibacterium sp.]